MIELTFSLTISLHIGENFGFTQHDSKSSNYFALRDQLLEGHINTLSGERLKIGMYCKTFEDYLKTARKYGFEIVEMEEARVSPENLNENPAFFDSVNGVPLHLVVKVRKPAAGMVDNSANIAAANTLSMLPKKLTWGRSATRNPENAFFLRIPDLVKKELYKASLECFNRGISVDDLDFEGDFPSRTFAELKNFSVSVRNALLHETGLVILKGLDLDVFGLDEMKNVACSKIAYYVSFSSCYYMSQKSRVYLTKYICVLNVTIFFISLLKASLQPYRSGGWFSSWPTL